MCLKYLKGHYKYKLHDTPIWATRDEVAEYMLHIQVYGKIREEQAMLAVVGHKWLENFCDVSTDYDWICQGPVFWNDQNVPDLDINQLHKQMVGGAYQYTKGDVTFM